MDNKKKTQNKTKPFIGFNQMNEYFKVSQDVECV